MRAAAEPEPWGIDCTYRALCTLSAGWVAEKDNSGDVIRSSRMVVTVSPERGKWSPTGTQADIAKFFNGSTPGVGLSIKTAEGDPLVEMRGWQMSVPNHKDGNADILSGGRNFHLTTRRALLRSWSKSRRVS